MKKIVLTYGLIAGFIVSALMAASMVYMHNNPGTGMGSGSMIVGYLTMLVAFSFIYIGIKNYRDKQLDGRISFGRAFSSGLLIALVASTLYVIMWALLYNLYMPDYMDNYIVTMLKDMEATSTADQLAVKKAEMEKMKEMYKQPVYFVLFTYAEILPVGILVSLICALILMRRKRQQAVAMA